VEDSTAHSTTVCLVVLAVTGSYAHKGCYNVHISQLLTLLVHWCDNAHCPTCLHLPYCHKLALHVPLAVLSTAVLYTYHLASLALHVLLSPLAQLSRTCNTLHCFKLPYLHIHISPLSHITRVLYGQFANSLSVGGANFTPVPL
jgi:hypothetical protein